MRLLLPVFLILPMAALAQDAGKSAPEVETVHSDAPYYVETISVDSDWQRAGLRPQEYDMRTEPVDGALNLDALVIRARPGAHTGYPDFATLVQWQDVPSQFLGKRVRLSARVKTDKVHWVEVWMRLDAKDRVVDRRGDHPRQLTLYNMDDRPIRGTTAWQRYAVVLDVPLETARLGFGFSLLGGQGTAWADGFVLEEVGEDVPVDRMRGRAPYD